MRNLFLLAFCCSIITTPLFGRYPQSTATAPAALPSKSTFVTGSNDSVARVAQTPRRAARKPLTHLLPLMKEEDESSEPTLTNLLDIEKFFRTIADNAITIDTGLVTKNDNPMTQQEITALFRKIINTGFLCTATGEETSLFTAICQSDEHAFLEAIEILNAMHKMILVSCVEAKIKFHGSLKTKIETLLVFCSLTSRMLTQKYGPYCRSGEPFNMTYANSKGTFELNLMEKHLAQLEQLMEQAATHPEAKLLIPIFLKKMSETKQRIKTLDAKFHKKHGLAHWFKRN